MSYNRLSEASRIWLEENIHHKPLDRWVSRLKSQAEGTMASHVRYFRLFLARYRYTPLSVYEARLDEVRSDDPLMWGVIRDQVLQVMRELVDGDFSDWPEEARIFIPRRTGRLEPTTARNLAKGVQSFFETFGDRMEIRIKSKDLPQGDSRGQRLIRPDQILEVVKHGGIKYPYRNVAVAMFLKDTGLRASDLSLFSVGDWLGARARVQFNKYGESFTKFQPERTRKENIVAEPHIGPEAFKAIDQYLKIERPGAASEEALFMDETGKALIGGAIGQLIKHMVRKGLGPEAEKVSCHSFRKLFETGLQAGSMPDKWIKYLQGKSRGVYSMPEDLQVSNGESLLMSRYMQAYDQIRVHETGNLRELKEKVEQLEVAAGKADENEARIQLLEEIIKRRGDLIC